MMSDNTTEWKGVAVKATLSAVALALTALATYKLFKRSSCRILLTQTCSSDSPRAMSTRVRVEMH